MKRNYFILLLGFFLSLFLPFLYTLSSETYDMIAISGYRYAAYHYLVIGVLVFLYLCHLLFKQFLKRDVQGLKYLITCLLIYFYAFPFRFVGSAGVSHIFSSFLTVLKIGLGIGYYLSLACVLGILWIIRKK